jgi:SAM-dependent methyltransferase
MVGAPRDAWTAGVAYDSYMGRWSRALARVCLAWLRPPSSAHWLEVGCGTGSLTSSIEEICEPASIVACDPSAAFVEHARHAVGNESTRFVVAGAEALPERDGGFDVAVSGLVLNFIAEPERALLAMRERTRSGGTVAAYVWDYDGGVDFLRFFWDEAVAFEPSAASLDEARRCSSWRKDALASLFRGAGLDQIEVDVINLPTVFADFDDYWTPFLGGTGPAPSHVESLEPARRDSLRERLRARLPIEPDGQIRLGARAWIARGAFG